MLSILQIFCATCSLKEDTLDNDIILCDGACKRGFHQNCLNPPLLTKDSNIYFPIPMLFKVLLFLLLIQTCDHCLCSPRGRGKMALPCMCLQDRLYRINK